MTNSITKMTTYPVQQDFNGRVDQVAIALRKDGFNAYVESSEDGKQFYLVTDARRASVLLVAGHGGFLI